MKDRGYKIRDGYGIHFITFATIQWIDVFTRKQYCDIFLDSIQYCISRKGLNLFAWCLMSNHVHMIISAGDGNLSSIIRDFKKFTSNAILECIAENNQESRKSWMIWLFKSAGEENARNKSFQFWQQDNHPIILESPSFTLSKLKYMHNNPVKAGIVFHAEDYRYSSAIDYNGGKGLLPVTILSAAQKIICI